MSALTNPCLTVLAQWWRGRVKGKIFFLFFLDILGSCCLLSLERMNVSIRGKFFNDKIRPITCNTVIGLVDLWCAFWLSSEHKITSTRCQQWFCTILKHVILRSTLFKTVSSFLFCIGCKENKDNIMGEVFRYCLSHRYLTSKPF